MTIKNKKAGPFIQTKRAKKIKGKTVIKGGTVIIKKKGKKPLAFKKGALTEMALRYGMSPKQFCNSKIANTPLAKKRCNFAFKGALAQGRKTAQK